ncbi:hypothetical protein [Phenylobacterium sp.]|uniref:hypothetical protein n=1 Tax=Phenylobacterium sp. TaxID=1871053 RepID=UPI002BCDA214|nr:hypothetical protein [Phenylobacterium sp.]HVI31279.1 hypothetical protein [Phenylobacterium sp.]
MTAPASTLRQETLFSAKPGEAAGLLEPLLLAVGGPGAALLSVTFDYGPAPAAPGPAVAEAWVERATRSLVFVHGRLAAADGAVLVTCSAVLRNATEA